MMPFLIAASLLFSGLHLSEASCRRPLKVAFVGDPQVDDAQELYYARKSIYSELRQRRDLDMLILLGDLVNDDVSLLQPSKESLDSLACPWFCVPGNHDRDFYGRKKGRAISADRSVDETRFRDFSTYSRVIGPVDTTFVKRNTRFVLMNDVRQDGRLGYFGGLDKRQKVFLDSVLSVTPHDMQVVLSAHIPFSEFLEKDSLQSVLSRHPNILMMCGHTHYAARSEILPGIEEVLAGAACGTFWRGEKDNAGIPYSLMNCGTPRGYYIAVFQDDGTYSLAYKCVLRPEKEVASAWIDSDGRLVVNVFGGAESGIVEVKYRGGSGWIKLEKTERIAPEVLMALKHNKIVRSSHGDYKEYIPLRKKASPHVWQSDLPVASGLLKTGAVVKIRYRDRSMSFRVKTYVKTLIL